MIELYIIRHGITPWNIAGKIQGNSDIELAEEGRKMARETSHALKTVHFDGIYSSPLNRAYETACILRGDRNLPVIKDERLKEISFGIHEGQSDQNIKNTDYNPASGCFFAAPVKYQPPEGGETLNELCERAADFLKELKQTRKDGERLLIVGHGALNKALLCELLQRDLKDFWTGELQRNCGVIIVNIHNNRTELVEENRIFYKLILQ